MSDYLTMRDGYYYYFRRVPKHIKPYDSRRHIKISLKTQDKATAKKRALVQNEAIEKFWRNLAQSAPTDTQRDTLYRDAVQKARMHGFVYRDITDLSENASAAELVDRLLALKAAEDKQPGAAVELGAALVGTADQPDIKLSEIWEIYRPKIGDRLVGKTDHQIRKWENPRKLAANNFIKAIGDKNILEINRKDVLAFHDWWLHRVTKQGKKPASANKNFRHVKDMLDIVFTALDITPPVDVETLFAKIKLRVVDDSRQSYEAEYVQRVFISSDALNGLNEEARALVYIMADTGARVAEITGLMPEDIRLDTPIPYIHIR